MFKFLHHLRSPPSVRASRTYYLCFSQINPFSSSLKPTQNSPNQHSFTVTYLVNSCGFSPEKALSKSKYVKFETPDKPDSVLAFFKSHGFTQIQISTIITQRPQTLLFDPAKTLLPRLEFLKSKGFSNTDVARVVSASPNIFQRSLEKTIIPSFNFISNLLESEEKTLASIKRYGGLLWFDHQTHVAPSIEILREAGVPNANIMILLTNHPRAFKTGMDKFALIVKEVEKMGFDPSRMNFVSAIRALRQMTKSTWGKKVEIYKKWGWTDDEIRVAFKLQPECMMASEEKIVGVMDFLVNKMGLESSLVARRPKLTTLSLEKRIVPRCAVYQILLLKGLINSNGISLTTLLQSSEKRFLENVVNRHKEEAPEILELYKEKLDLVRTCV
ncbi:Transcription termination factor like [Actinidia chinensis var. chinensis]|uniref:Transcription termination factor like n=1 Tax=Actinidia chinensis var. chinensis TaxID=1590841 RepID=A0A2R6P4D0_ACTCC|nr:Transcription termination factor like [Actinidia chinensis var. chinensis]